MTGDDLKNMQDHFLEGAKAIVKESGRLRPVGFVITLRRHLDKLFESGWALEIIDPKSCVIDGQDDKVAAVILDLLMDWKRMYHAVLNVFPKTRDILPPMVALAEQLKVDDPHKRVMRPFLAQAQLDDKDVIAATMRHVCAQAEAFACIMQSEAWVRVIDPAEDPDKISARLGDDPKSTEVVYSAMETYEFTRMITVPVHREASSAKKSKKRDDGRVVGFGEPAEGIDAPDNTNVAEGRFARFLKPLGVAS